MQYEFLKQFSKRMKHVGMYSLLMQNSFQKQTWKQFGFMSVDEQMNLVFAVLLYIMEQSLKEENCTLDEISTYIDELNSNAFHKNLSYEDCKELGDFIINIVLSNEGRAMYFDCYNFDEKAYNKMNIRYVSNKIIYLDEEIRRTSYYLTDDGYNLMLSTLEIEGNLKLTIHEMIFKMHLERQSYDKAVGEIKNVFNLLRIQLQKIFEAMQKIKRNALNYSIADYQNILVENMDTLSNTKQKFESYRILVKSRVDELEQKNINISKLSKDEEDKLSNLNIIDQYLGRAIDEHQKILNSHFDLKILYEKELQMLTQMSLIKRFSLRTDFYDKVLENPDALENMHYFFRPLFHQEIPKAYNLTKSFMQQKPISKNEDQEEADIMDFDEEKWQEQIEEQRRRKLAKYEKSLSFIIEKAMDTGSITLDELQKECDTPESEVLKALIPNVDIFKEIMVELIRNKNIDIDQLKRERSEYIVDEKTEFRLNVMLLSILEQIDKEEKIKAIRITRLEKEDIVQFCNITDEEGNIKTIRCSNVKIEVV